jgi:hypothetical protein
MSFIICSLLVTLFEKLNHANAILGHAAGMNEIMTYMQRFET